MCARSTWPSANNCGATGRTAASPPMAWPARKTSCSATCCKTWPNASDRPRRVLIPVAAVLLYGKLGNPRAAADVSVMASAVEPHADDTGDDMALAINALAQRLRNAPDDADGWYTLARSYETLGRYTDAVAAYQQVLRLVPGQPAVLADLADALLSANQGVPDANAVAAVAQSLAALQWLQQQGAEQIYFKYCSTFDSTPQGNIGPVTDALMTQLGTAFTIATPAFPDNKRTVFKGYLSA
ncbi:hypothetical protein G6F65_018173 [Rhizopus arrhizus]|nr:hypothetical protein G6F65_018173 [Rhizopus arrhizus]